MKPEIKINQEPLSKSEIEKQMNFEKFMAGYQPPVKTGWLAKSAKFYLSASIAVVGILALAYFMFNREQAPSPSQLLFIQPPVAELAVDTNKIVLNTEKDTTLVLPSGTSIFIPAGAFISANGNSASGTIELDYREFHDQVDLMFSGIPMHYDTAGSRHQFESAGMFEIHAKQNGEQLALKPGKELTINMVSYNKDNYFNAYYLDTAQKKWIYNADNTRKMKDGVTEQLQDRLIAPELAKQSAELIEPKKANPSLYNFVIDYKKEEFPELAVYEGVKFEVDKDFDTKLCKMVWEDVYVKRHDEKRYVVTFKIAGKSASVLATPVLDDKDFEAAMTEYTKQRKAHLVTARKQVDSLARAQAENAALASASNQNTRFERAIQKGTVYRSIVVGRLGIWNSDYYEALALQRVRDRIDFERKGGSPSAEFVDKSGKKIYLKTLYLTKRDVNAIYPLTPKEFSAFPLTFVQNMDIIVGVTSTFDVVYLQDSELQELEAQGNKVIIKMNDMDLSKKDLQEIKSKLRI
jgi:hypothetical protein